MDKARIKKLIDDLENLKKEHEEAANKYDFMVPRANGPRQYHRGHAHAYENVLLTLESILSLPEMTEEEALGGLVDGLKGLN
jgi:hypothetical protein